MLLSFVSASLGISPAKYETNFESNHKYTFKFDAISDSPEKEIEVYVEGDLSQYASLDKDKLIGGGSFQVNLILPEEVEKSGKNTLIVGVREIPSESEFIGTNVNIRAIVNVYVPYPGKYLEAQLNVPDANVGNLIPVELHVINRGKDSLEVSPVILFFDSQMNEAGRLTFQPATLNTSEDRYFRKYLNSSGLRPGNYIAQAKISYNGDLFEVNRSFRIGSLFVNITDFTRELRKGGIRKYFVDVESKWNGELSEVFADVNLSNGVENITFRTPSVTLKAWESKKIEGFLDTSDLEGFYNTTVMLNYENKNSLAYGVLVVTAFNSLLWIGIGAVVIILTIIAFIVFRKKLYKKNKK